MTITPPPFIIRRAASRAHTSTPSRFTRNTRRQSSGELSRNGCRTLIPAFATSTSSPPSNSSTRSNTAATAAGSATSATNAPASPSTSPSRAIDTTRAPSATNRRDVAAPIPLVPPVMTTRLPSSRLTRRSYDHSLLVLQRVEDVEPRRPPRGHDRRHHPRDDRDEREDHERQHRHVEADALAREPLRHERGQEQPERQPEPRPDQRRDHALVPDHPPHLPPRHPDRSQHPELACPLEHREHERVHHPEQADDHGQGQQDVQELEQLVDAVRPVRHPVVARAQLHVREAGQRALQPRSRR